MTRTATPTAADRRYARREASDSRYAERLAEREEARAQAAADARANGLPELIGSEAQCSWALTLRRDALAAFSARMSRAGDAWTFTVYESAMAAVSTITAAHWWIENVAKRRTETPDPLTGGVLPGPEALALEWIGYAITILEAAAVRQEGRKAA